MKNLAIIIGNLGGDVDVKRTQAGKAVASFNVATTDRWKGQDGQMQESVEWHKIIAWERLGEICGEYLTKGSKVYIEGKIQTRSWDDQDGKKRYTTEIVAREMKMLSPRNGESNSGGGGNSEHPQGGFGGTGEDIPPF